MTTLPPPTPALIPAAVRGGGNGMRAYFLDGISIPGGWSYCYRSRHRSRTSFARFRIAIPLYTVHSYADTVLPAAMNFQIGFEYPYQFGASGLTARTPVTFGGANYGSFNGSTTTGYLLSDWVYLPAPVAAGNFFGIWMTVESPTQTPNSLPFCEYSSDAWGAYEGYVFANSSLIGSNTAVSGTSVTRSPTALTGGLGYSIVPAMILVDHPANAIMPALVGTSIFDGYGEGQNGSGNYGAFSQGNQFRNRGFMARWVNEYLAANYVSISVAGDSYGSQLVANATKFRQSLLALANPTHIVSDMGTNDLAAGLTAANIRPNAVTANAAWVAAAGGCPLIMSTCIPRTTATDNWATTANQTAITGFGNSSSGRGAWNNYIRAAPVSLGAKAFLDPCRVIESGYLDGVQATETSIWNAIGSAYGYTADGIHPNSSGHAFIAAGLPSSFPA